MKALTSADRELLAEICPELSEELDDRTLHTYRETGWEIECNVSFKTLLSIARRFVAMGEKIKKYEKIINKADKTIHALARRAEGRPR